MQFMGTHSNEGFRIHNYLLKNHLLWLYGSEKQPVCVEF